MVEFWQPQLGGWTITIAFFFFQQCGCFAQSHDVMSKNVHLQDMEEQKSVVFTSLDKTL